MLKKKNRLSKKEFNRFFSSGKRHHSPTLLVVYVPHSEFHAAVVVSKKIAKNAVKRNKIRRRVYGILHGLFKTSGVTGVYIVVVKQSAVVPTVTTLKEELTTLLGRISNTR